MSEQNHDQDQGYKIIRDFSPADEWRAHLVLAKEGGQSIDDRLFDLVHELPSNTLSLPRIECEPIDDDSFLLRLFINRELPAKFLTRADALNKAAGFIFNAMQVTGNGDMQVSNAYLQRSSAIEAYERSANHASDAAHLPEKYWFDVTAATQQEISALGRARQSLGNIETT